MNSLEKLLIGAAITLFSIVAAVILDAPLANLIGLQVGLGNRGAFLLGAAIASLFTFALTIILVRSSFAQNWFTMRRLRRLEGIEETFGRPFAGSVPMVDFPIRELYDVKSRTFEAMSSITDRLMNDFSERPPKQILITSTCAAEGKSTLANGIGIILARRGKRVLIVDADLRSPRQHYLFTSAATGLLDLNLAKKPADPTRLFGLSNVLTNESDPESAIKEVGFKGLHLLPAGPIPPSPTDLVTSDYCAKVLKDLEDHYDVVIVDTAPVLGLADAPALARRAEFIVYAVRHGDVHPKLALGAFKRIAEHANTVLVGTALNTSGYAYGYSYEYSYANSIGDDGDDGRKSPRLSLYIQEFIAWLISIRIPIILLALLVFIGLRLHSYYFPSEFSDAPSNIERAYAEGPMLRIDAELGEISAQDHGGKELGSALRRVAKGIKAPFEEVMPQTKRVVVRFHGSRRDRLGNLRKIPIFEATFTREDLAAVNLEVIDRSALLDLADIRLFDPLYSAEVSSKCKTKVAGIPQALCDATQRRHANTVSGDADNKGKLETQSTGQTRGER